MTEQQATAPCPWFDEDEDGSASGPLCGKPVTHFSCNLPGGRTHPGRPNACEAHKCRCEQVARGEACKEPRPTDGSPPENGYTLEEDARGQRKVAIYAGGQLRHQCVHEGVVAAGREADAVKCAAVDLSSGEVCWTVQREIGRATDETLPGLLVAFGALLDLTMRRASHPRSPAIQVPALPINEGDQALVDSMVTKATGKGRPIPREDRPRADPRDVAALRDHITVLATDLANMSLRVGHLEALHKGAGVERAEPVEDGPQTEEAKELIAMSIGERIRRLVALANEVAALRKVADAVRQHRDGDGTASDSFDALSAYEDQRRRSTP